MNCSQKVVALTLFLPRNTPRCARNVFSYKAVFLPERNTALEGISKYCAILIKARKHLMFRGIRTSSLWSLTFLAPTRFIWLKLNLKRLISKGLNTALFVSWFSFIFLNGTCFHFYTWVLITLTGFSNFPDDLFFSKENIKRSRWRMQ